MGPGSDRPSRFSGTRRRRGDDTCQFLGKAARENNIHLVMGCNEIDDAVASHTLYNSLLYFDRARVLYGRDRKLMPTFIERIFWSSGNADDLQVYETDIGRLGGLVCAEHLTPLVRASTISFGEDIHVGVFPGTSIRMTCRPTSPSGTR